MSTPKRTSPNGKQRLLSFLRGLLDDPTHSNIIIWTNQTEQEFQLLKPHKVAELWGSATGNPQMNYDKMSRGLRYFYTNNTLKKMPGKNSGYQFLDGNVTSMDVKLLNFAGINTSPVNNFNVSSFIGANNRFFVTSSG
uniref:ETS domain-containing protein n=1 Tax=Caenorhabditis tropicalis TaxID=1561998 RepID=A0A1I7T4W5_9PELO